MNFVSFEAQVMGRIEKIVFHSEEDGYTVLSLQTEDKAVGKITVVGHLPHFELGQQVSFEGSWQANPKRGKQFVAKKYIVKAAQLSMEKFLTQHIDGVGPSTAQKLIQAFGENLVDILNHNPSKIQSIPGLKNQRYQRLIKSWNQQKRSLEVLLFLTNHGLNFAQASRVYLKYQDQTIDKIKENPYRLIKDVDRIGFQTADSLALKLAFPLADPRRIEGGIHYLLQEAIREGHCGLFERLLLIELEDLLKIKIDNRGEVIQQAHDNKIIVKDTLFGEPCSYVPHLWEQEKQIASVLIKLKEESIPQSLNKTLTKALEEVIEHEKLPLTEEQYQAVLLALMSKVFVLTGGPGVGKTTLIRILTRVFTKQKMNFALCAPTGRAAKRVSESTGFIAKTIHRLLEYDPFSHTFAFQANFPLPVEVVIVDEASMLDVPLCATLLQALKAQARIIFVGDVDQLASVGPGNVLKSLIASNKIPFFALKTIFRQASTSQIIVNAHRVNQGLLPQINKSSERDFFLIRLKPEEQQEKILDIVALQLPQKFGFDPYSDIQVLTPMNGGPLGVDNLNNLLQERLNPNDETKKSIKHVSGFLRLGDKVIQIVNNYEKNIFNGDLGKVIEINHGQKKVTILFDKHPVSYEFKELEQLRLAYAISVHKSQGSEYSAAVVVLSMTQRMMLKRNLLYTAMTRGKACVVIITSVQALEYAIKKDEGIKRINKLEEWLQNE